MFFKISEPIFVNICVCLENNTKKVGLRYKGPAGSRKYGTCDESQLQEDLKRIAAWHSQRFVCTQLGIVCSTLQNKLKQKNMQRPGRPTGTVLSEKEELAIAEHFLATAEYGFPFDGMDIMMLVKIILAN